MSDLPDGFIVDPLPTGKLAPKAAPVGVSSKPDPKGQKPTASASTGGASGDWTEDPPAAPAAKGKAAVAPASDGSALPPGFHVDPKKEESVLPYLADRFKEGIGNFASFLPGMTDLATNRIANNPTTVGQESVNAVSNLALSAAQKIKLALGIDKPKGLTDLINPAKPDPTANTVDSSLGATVKSGWDQLLGVHHTPVPTDQYGGISKSNEYMGKIAEFVGANLVPGGGMAAEAERKLATFITSNLGAAASGMGAVEGKEWGGKLADTFGVDKERGEQIGEFLGSLTGPGAVGMGSQALLKSQSMTKSAMRSADITGVSKEAQKAAANSMLARDLQQGLEHAPDSQANLARSLELSKEVPGWNPTIAQASDAPALVAMQKEVANKSGEALAKAAAADARNTEAIANFKNEKFPTQPAVTVEAGEIPPGGGAPAVRPYSTDPVLDPARIRLNTSKQVQDLQIQKNAADLDALGAKYQRSIDNEDIGVQLRDKYWEARQVAKAQQDSNLADVYRTAKTFGVTEDMTDVRQAVQKIVGSDRTTFQDMPPLFSKILNEYPEGQAATVERQAVTPTGAQKPIFRQVMTKPAVAARDEASFEELHSLYKQANKDWADATAAGDSTKAAYMGMIRDQLKDKVSKYNGPEYGALGQKFSDFNRGYAGYARTFKEGAGADIAKRTKNGISRDAEDIVSKTFLKAGDKKKGLQDFFAIYGNDQDAASLLRDGLTDSFSRTAMRTGQFNPKAATGWLKQHETAMGELPDLRQKLETAAQQGNMFVNRQKMLNIQRKVLDRTMLAKVAQSNNSEALITRALGDSKDGPKVLKALMVGAITPANKQAVARAIVDSVTAKGQGLDFIMKHEAALKPVMNQLGPDHWNNLKKISEMEGIAARVKAPTQVELSKLQDAGEQLAGTSVKGLFARAMAAKQGRISEGYAVMDVGGRFFYKIRSEEMNRLREAAMFDPDLAGLMAKLGKQSAKPTKDQLLDLQRMSFNAGVVSSVEANGREQKRRVGRAAE